MRPLATVGGACCSFSPQDAARFYDVPANATGAGRDVVIAGAYAWSDADVTAFDAAWGRPPLPAGSGQECASPVGGAGCQFDPTQSLEVALDVEVSHGLAPGARVANVMSASTSLADFAVMYARVVEGHPGAIVSTSWGACESPAVEAFALAVHS